MSYQLDVLIIKVRLKHNQSSAGSNLVWEDSELEGYINDAIKHIISNGDLSLIQSGAFKTDTVANAGSGFGNKPSDYLRYANLKVDDYWVEKIIPMERLHEINKIEGNTLTASGSETKYALDYSGTQFLIYPNDFTTSTLIYIAEPTDLTGSATSPLTNTGDSYAVDWAYALALESKQFQAELAQAIFNRINKVLGL